MAGSTQVIKRIKEPEPIFKTETEETLACLIIDDPLLKPKYGCLDYCKLLNEMKEHRFFSEIAFIPWNYKRSDPGIVKLFADNPDYYGICVHGCDHSGNEFGKTNYEEIASLSATALWRMWEHKKITGLPFDPVFVFPQGKFSSISMKVLKEHGYFAAFNSGLEATDYENVPALENECAATTIYHDFPLFLRYYPERRPEFVHAMKSGRPILIAEHHTAFRNGYKDITDTVDWINSLGNIRWTSLLNIAEHYLGKRYENSLKLPDNPPLRTNSSALYARRVLSEIRDNYVDTNSIIAKLYKNVRSQFRY